MLYVDLGNMVLALNIFQLKDSTVQEYLQQERVVTMLDMNSYTIYFGIKWEDIEDPEKGKYQSRLLLRRKEDQMLDNKWTYDPFLSKGLDIATIQKEINENLSDAQSIEYSFSQNHIKNSSLLLSSFKNSEVANQLLNQLQDLERKQ